MGFCFIAGVVAVMIARRHPSISAALPDLLAVLVTISIPMMMSSSTSARKRTFLGGRPDHTVEGDHILVADGAIGATARPVGNAAFVRFAP